YAAALGRAGEKDKALAQLDKLPLDGQAVPVVEIVTVYSEIEAFDACAASLGKQIAKEKTVELLIHQSSCYLAQKKTKEGEAALRDAVASFPESDIAHYYLAKYLSGAGKKAEAKKH